MRAVCRKFLLCTRRGTYTKKFTKMLNVDEELLAFFASLLNKLPSTTNTLRKRDVFFIIFILIDISRSNSNNFSNIVKKSETFLYVTSRRATLRDEKQFYESFTTLSFLSVPRRVFKCRFPGTIKMNLCRTQGRCITKPRIE